MLLSIKMIKDKLKIITIKTQVPNVPTKRFNISTIAKPSSPFKLPLIVAACIIKIVTKRRRKDRMISTLLMENSLFLYIKKDGAISKNG